MAEYITENVFAYGVDGNGDDQVFQTDDDGAIIIV